MKSEPDTTELTPEEIAAEQARVAEIREQKRLATIARAASVRRLSMQLSEHFRHMDSVHHVVEMAGDISSEQAQQVADLINAIRNLSDRLAQELGFDVDEAAPSQAAVDRIHELEGILSAERKSAADALALLTDRIAGLEKDLDAATAAPVPAPNDQPVSDPPAGT